MSNEFLVLKLKVVCESLIIYLQRDEWKGNVNFIA